MRTIAIEDRPELLPLLRSVRDHGFVVITDHGRPVAVLQQPEVTKPADMFAFRRAFLSPPSTFSEVAEMRRADG